MGLNWYICKNGYYQLVRTDGSAFEFISFSPFTGEEFPSAQMWAVQDNVISYFFNRTSHQEFNELSEDLHLYSSEFDISNIPEPLKHLLTEREWFDKHISRLRKQHKNGEFCPEFSVLISTLYNSEPREVLSMIPIKYCPFCGIALPPDFQQENWWEKEFKNFDWYKKHKMYEWADDYVDDHDWEYPDE